MNTGIYYSAACYMQTEKQIKLRDCALFFFFAADLLLHQKCKMNFCLDQNG